VTGRAGIEIEKARLRDRLRGELAALAPEARRVSSSKVVTRLESLAEVVSAQNLLVFQPLATEVDITPVFESALARGRTVFAPRIEANELRFCRVRPQTTWSRGAFGILQPDSVEVIRERDFDRGPTVVLVPGLGFSQSGERLGRGGGHYDRALGAAPLIGKVLRIGLGFDFQILDSMPTADHDIPMDLVVTECRALHTAPEKTR
jgi:5-formyltetrahydrofolate cyclo-ligase